MRFLNRGGKKVKMLRLENKIAVITGSDRGIGAAIANAYAGEGAKVVITYFKQRKKAQEVAKKINADLMLQLDVKNRAGVRKMFKEIKKKYGRVDILVNNAGINRPADFNQQTDKDWDEVLAVDLKGVFICCQEALPYMSDNGRIINIGSLSGQYGGPRTPAYAAAKAGVIALTHCLARFVAKRGITVNCISPGVIQSELTKNTMPDALRRYILPQILLGRFGRYDELTEAAIFLASDGSSYMTAQTININGGIWT